MCDDGGCFRTMAKIILIVTNIIFLLAGLLMLGFGIALVVAPHQMISFMFEKMPMDVFDNAPEGVFTELVKGIGIFMIILGGVVVIIAFLGFFGACCESKCLLVTYAVILIIIVLAEIALIIFAAVFPDKFEGYAKEAFTKSFKDGFKDAQRNDTGYLDTTNLDSDSKFWFYFQLVYQCCGVDKPTDYENLNNWEKFNCDPPCLPEPVVPISCCTRNEENKVPGHVDDFQDRKQCLASAGSQYTYQNGCISKFFSEGNEFVSSYGKIAIGIAAGIVGLEIILIIFAFVMCCTGQFSNKYV